MIHLHAYEPFSVFFYDFTGAFGFMLERIGAGGSYFLALEIVLVGLLDYYIRRLF